MSRSSLSSPDQPFDCSLRRPLDLSPDFVAGDTWQLLYLDRSKFPVNLEWLVGVDGTLVNTPKAGGELNRFVGRGLNPDG